jgi:hypothetical protein
MTRLSFIATRRNGIETYRFAGLPEPVTLDCRNLSRAERLFAVGSLFGYAATALERIQRRH